VVAAGARVTDFGRGRFIGVPMPLIFGVLAVLLAWLMMNATSFGAYVRSIGADSKGARRAGVPREAVTWSVYGICGAFAGFGGFISLSQTSSASSVFGQGAEFLSIAAAVLGGTSLFGGRGSLWAPVAGAVLIMTVQNGLVMINANPYAYPVITGGVIFLAALLDGVRSSVVARISRRQIYKVSPT
jgi:ribose/xylose/arabinose/galactoside ABC-type transport system permease subunit